MKCENCNFNCGFHKEIHDLIERGPYISEWKNTYQSMDPEEIINFLNYWIQELYDLHQVEFDPLSKGIILNCLFRETLEVYPGNLISNELRDQLTSKMNEKTNPFDIMRLKIGKLIDEKKFQEVKSEVNKIFDIYKDYIGSNKYIDQNLQNFLFSVIKNFRTKEMDLKTLIFLTNTYLEFVKNKDQDLNQALFYIQIASYFFKRKEKDLAKECLIESKGIYYALGFEKDEAKVNRILNDFVKAKKPNKAKASKKSKKSKKRKKK